MPPLGDLVGDEKMQRSNLIPIAVKKSGYKIEAPCR
jgi:hypothetical protein